MELVPIGETARSGKRQLQQKTLLKDSLGLLNDSSFPQDSPPLQDPDGYKAFRGIFAGQAPATALSSVF